MDKNCRTAIHVTTLLLSTALPSMALALDAGDPRDPETWRTAEFNAQWGLSAIDAEYAYMLGYDGSGIRVGVVDSGLDISHPEFFGRYVEGITYDPEKPWTFVAEGHGTTVASVIAANRDGTGMHGVAPGATIVQAGASDIPGYLDTDAVNYGIRTLIDRGVKIINNSFGDGIITETTAEQFEATFSSNLSAYRYAVSRGGLLVFSAMNDGAAQPSVDAGLPYLFPELEQGWLAVVATGPTHMPNWSNECGVAMNWCLTAPGGDGATRWDPDKGVWVWANPQDNIMVAVPGGAYSRETGTSLAAPFVSGTAALAAQAFPYMTMAQIRQVLLGTATDIGLPGVDPVFGYGRVSAGRAVHGPGKFDWGDFHAVITDGESEWSNNITGAGGLIKSGDGILVMTGDSAYQGSTRVDGGILAIAGSIASGTFVDGDGMLSGDGIIRGNVDNGGAVNPGWGRRGGALTVDGNYRQSSDAWFLVNLDAPDGTSRLDVTGSADIAGNVDVRVRPENYKGDGRHTVLSALGGVTGRFEDDCGCHAFLDLSLSYDPTTVYLDVARNAVAFADLAPTRNGAAAAEAIERLGVGRPLHDLAVTLDADTASDLFGQLPGEVYGSTVTGLIENSQVIGNQMNDRLRSAFETVGAKARPIVVTDDLTTGSIAKEVQSGAWGAAFGAWGHTDGDGNAEALSRSTGGFVTGLDGLINDDWRLGFLAGYSSSSFKVDDRRSSTSSDNYHLGVYGGTQWGGLSFRSSLAYTWSDIDSSRNILSPVLVDSLAADYRAGTTQVFGELGYGLQAGRLAFEPFANLAYVNVHTDGFTEKGGAAALAVQSGSDDTTFTTLGLRLATDFELGTTKATARGLLGWRHAYGDVTPAVAEAFSGSDAFSVAGAPIARDSALVEAGVDFAVTPAATFGIAYQGQIASTAREHGVRADLTVKF
ncbi:autotransporter domain-containing protein [Ensifer adhaerens]|uniref:autotransporter domain-containing protein n=1 Tax=Ensifer adhaerens TaxID=106592 RepID=UPI001CBE6B17|nr:autotransporter serine protease [Ensifer adhaerens]MBZ7925144.1 autotransporter domain-containing protein [Ensifer adhaerens]UAX95672.1 autotransporter domain-containing protein [Ensifer adhaerens]UAY02436.1 autotransporter domain-containing protein [Ensifer adhaerens]UAY10420.1 autotransporter domain-containing protein [Ensifer adhaerens]